MEGFQAFDKTLMSIPKSLGLELGKPVISAVHNIIEGYVYPHKSNPEMN